MEHFSFLYSYRYTMKQKYISLRVPADIYNQWKLVAKSKDRSLPACIIHAMKLYAEKYPVEVPAEPNKPARGNIFAEVALKR